MAKNKFGNNRNKNDKSENGLSYDKIIAGINKVRKNSNNLNSLKSLLNNFYQEFEKLSFEDKQQELKSDKFKKISSEIKELKYQELISIIKKMEAEKKLSDNEKIIEKLDSLEEENLNPQGKNIDDILSNVEDMKAIINKDFWTILQKNIKIPENKVNLTPIISEIGKSKLELENSHETINKEIKDTQSLIKDIKFPSFPKIPTDYLKKSDFDNYKKSFKEDLNFSLDNKLKPLNDIKNSIDDLETIPANLNEIKDKIKNLDEKMDNLSNINNKIPTNIPKEEKAILELSKYMQDGITQFENIAKEYVSKISELEKLEETKNKHQKEIETIKKDSFEEGKKEGQIELIKKLAENYPTRFKDLKNSFKEFITEKFKENEILDINDKNKNDLLPFINFKGEIINGKYKVISSAILLEKSILFKANIKKYEEVKIEETPISEDEKKETKSNDNSIEDIKKAENNSNEVKE